MNFSQMLQNILRSNYVKIKFNFHFYVGRNPKMKSAQFVLFYSILQASFRKVQGSSCKCVLHRWKICENYKSFPEILYKQLQLVLKQIHEYICQNFILRTDSASKLNLAGLKSITASKDAIVKIKRPFLRDLESQIPNLALFFTFELRIGPKRAGIRPSHKFDKELNLKILK